MSTLWVLTANRGFAKIFEVKGCGRQVKEIHHLDASEQKLFILKVAVLLQEGKDSKAYDEFGFCGRALFAWRAQAADFAANQKGHGQGSRQRFARTFQ